MIDSFILGFALLCAAVVGVIVMAAIFGLGVVYGNELFADLERYVVWLTQG